MSKSPPDPAEKRLKVDNFDYSALCTKMVEMTDGMSGREIAKLGVAWQAAAYASEDGVLTEKMVLDIVQDHVRQHKQKRMVQGAALGCRERTSGFK